jgi:hypothetical protein
MSYFANWTDLKALVHKFKFPIPFDLEGRGVITNININAPILVQAKCVHYLGGVEHRLTNKRSDH